MGDRVAVRLAALGIELPQALKLRAAKIPGYRLPGELFSDIFAKQGQGARIAVGAASMPPGMAVESKARIGIRAICWCCKKTTHGRA